jgi:hypothetical protein
MRMALADLRAAEPEHLARGGADSAFVTRQASCPTLRIWPSCYGRRCRYRETMSVRVSPGSCLLAIAVLGCGLHMPSGTMPLPSQVDPSGVDIVAEDPRLKPPLLSIAAHPEWSDGLTSALRAAKVVSSLRELCVEVTQPAGPTLYVTVDVRDMPWRVLAVVILEPGVDEEPQILFERDDFFEADLCRMVLAGTASPFPSDGDTIRVTGGISNPAQIAAIQEALHRTPADFGIDATAEPEISLRPIPEGARSVDQACYEGVVYQGGPRSKVVLGLRKVGGLWRFESVRVVEMALRTPEQAEPGEC